jgi:hypothetical protein
MWNFFFVVSVCTLAIYFFQKTKRKHKVFEVFFFAIFSKKEKITAIFRPGYYYLSRQL